MLFILSTIISLLSPQLVWFGHICDEWSAFSVALAWKTSEVLPGDYKNVILNRGINTMYFAPK